METISHLRFPNQQHQREGWLGLVDWVPGSAVEFCKLFAEFEAAGKKPNVLVAYHHQQQQQQQQPPGDERECGRRRRSGLLGASAVGGCGLVLTNNPFYRHHPTSTTSTNNTSDSSTVISMEAVMVGTAAVVTSDRCAWFNKTIDTLVFCPTGAGPEQEEMVTRSRIQCLPLVRFSSDILDLDNVDAPSNQAVWDCHVELQSVLDELFNQTKTNLTRTHPSSDPRNLSTAS